MDQLNFLLARVQNSTALLLLPCLSNLGLKTQMLKIEGTTTTTAPQTPLFAGTPTVHAHSPEKSY